MLAFHLVPALLAFATVVTAQTFAFNGQIFTRGLAIVDSPGVSSTFHAGSTMPVAIDISGDGQLPTAAAIPGSKANTRFDSLEIYLISYANSLNLTIAGPDANLFVQEPDSTVKHINYNISSCVPSGQYNFSLYEVSHFSDQQYFIISNIPVEIQNTNQQGGCNQTNGLDSSPQFDHTLSRSPWLPDTNGTVTSIAPAPTSGKSGALGLNLSLATFSLSLLFVMYSIHAW